MDSETPQPLQGVVKGIRDSARYLLATLGAIGAVLVSGLTLTSMFSGAHPVVAGIGLGVALLVLLVLIGLVVSVLTPRSITLGELAQQENAERPSPVVKRLKEDESLFAGQDSELKIFHHECISALKERAEAIEAYLDAPSEPKQEKMEAKSYRAQVLSDASATILETAVLFKLEQRYSPGRRALMGALAVVAAIGIGFFAWGSTGSASDSSGSGSGSQVDSEKSSERLWLEHLMATSGFRIERLEREAENVSGEAADGRIAQAQSAQAKVHEREEEALEALPAG